MKLIIFLVLFLIFSLTTVFGQVPKNKIIRNLAVGDRGNDVKVLQELLAKEGLYPASLITGFFGSLTSRAVARFQEKYSSEILAPLGFSKGTGFVGPSTRNKINQLIEKSLSVIFSKDLPLPGETITVKFLDKKVSVEKAVWNGKEVPFFNFGGNDIVVLPIAVNLSPGFYQLVVTLNNGDVFTQNIRVGGKNFEKIVLGQPKDSPIKREELAVKVQERKVDLDKIFSEKSPNIFFSDAFVWPLDEKMIISVPFGTIYKTGSAEIKHMGVDLAAEIGTPVLAINDGRVRKAYFDPVYGNSIILDHGRGIFSYYIHLNEIKTKEDVLVKRGEVIGTVGQTGYATGPHLHLSIKVAGISVDPINFISTLH
jgi:murein DD-endopeptidase MepM/ murein hydrolase activator NlpD